jgi:hypothetical protein
MDHKIERTLYFLVLLISQNLKALQNIGGFFLLPECLGTLPEAQGWLWYWSWLWHWLGLQCWLWLCYWLWSWFTGIRTRSSKPIERSLSCFPDRGDTYTPEKSKTPQKP